MLEYALEKLPSHHTLTNGLHLTVRPLQEADERAFEAFYSEIPEQERFLNKHRLTVGSQLHDWCHSLDFERQLPLVAFAGDRVAGYATLHQRPGGWKRHIGMVGALVHPEFRGFGVLRALLGGVVDAAQHAGLTKLEAEFNGERTNTILSFANCGFVELVRIRDYLQDMRAQPHDYVLLGMSLTTDFEYTGAGD